MYSVLLGKPEGKRQLGRPRRRWVDNLGCISRRWDVDIRTGLGWPRIETLGCISRRWDVDIWTGLGWPRIETGGGCL